MSKSNKNQQPAQQKPNEQATPNHAPSEELKDTPVVDPSAQSEGATNGDAPAAPVDAPVLEKGEPLGQTTAANEDGVKTAQHEVLGTVDGKRSEEELQAIHNPTKESVDLSKADEPVKGERGRSRFVATLDESPFAPEKPVSNVSPEAMAKQQSENAASIYIDRISKDGTAGEKMVIEAMEAYLAVMAASSPLSQSVIVREQTRLYTMFKNIGRRTDDFRKAVVVARFYFKTHAEGAFHDYRLYRGHEALQMSADDRKAFYSYLQFYKILASVNDLKDVKKSVDTARSLTNPVIPAEVKERYVSLVS